MKQPRIEKWIRMGKLKAKHIEAGEEQEFTAFGFTISNAKVALLSIPLISLTIFGVLMATFPSSFASVLNGSSVSASRWEGVGFAILGALLVLVLRNDMRKRVVLVPLGIFCFVDGRYCCIDWQGVAEIVLYRERNLGIRIKNPDTLKVSRWARQWMELCRREYGMDLWYSTFYLAIPARSLIKVVGYFAEHPEERAKIGTPEGLEQLKKILAEDSAK